jgi:uncharacterized protein YjlB
LGSLEVITFYFKDDGSIPNNPSLPVLLYPGALKDRAAQAETIFNQHNWLNSWINGVYNFHHYHSNAHEVLGIIRGSATLQIGGGNGKAVKVNAADVIVLPAGTGHKRVTSSSDFSVAGAYPDGMSCNLKTGKEDERPEVLEDIKHVPVPEKDPLYGENGPLIQLWLSV